MLCSVVALYQALGQAHIGMCLFFTRKPEEKNKMETRLPYPDPASAGKVQSDDTLSAVFSVLCALSRFYAFNDHLLGGDTPRLLLLNRIASGVELELAASGIREPYAADLIHIEEELNIGIRSRVPGKNLVAVTFAPVRPRLGPLREICGTGADRYRVGIGIGLSRKSYRADWYARETSVRRQMEESFPQWVEWAPFLGSSPET